ncbi:hypothetical protein QYE76_038223 [Lolium multiflorum]|uniref:Uncharacterized protein n=1 Tax=Lolium multiflorum TaxID=4521 RepID=A0AAD8T746_LOLMU|nr:hypothetical protein QYE76_038223 [Lolium multiflorum]
MTSTDLGSAEWERSKISGQDINMLKKMGFSKKENALQFPKEESYPKPPINYRGLVLASLPPLPEGGEVEERAVVDDDNQNTRALPLKSRVPTNPRLLDDEEEEQTVDAAARTSTSRTLIVSEAQHDGDEISPPQQDIVQPPPVESPRASPSKRTRVEPSKESIQFPGGSSTPSLDDPLMKEFIRLGTQFVGYRDYTKKLEGDLAESNKRADALAVKLKQSEEARQKAEKDAATIEDLRKRLHNAETSLSNNIARQSAREAEILSRLESQTRRFIRITHQEYEVEGPEGDELLDALTLVEIHGDEARDGLENAEASLLKLFPYFFPKKEAPSTFVELAKTFNGPEDLGLKLRQEGLKIGVEGTVALIADSQQNVEWAKVGDIGEMETKKWQSLIRAAKPSARPILSFLGVKPAPAPSASKPEVK